MEGFGRKETAQKSLSGALISSGKRVEFLTNKLGNRTNCKKTLQRHFVAQTPVC